MTKMNVRDVVRFVLRASRAVRTAKNDQERYYRLYVCCDQVITSVAEVRITGIRQ